MNLLYLPGKDGGHGWLRLSDVVHIAKLAILNGDHEPKGGGPDPQDFNGLHPTTISCLIGRALRSGGVVVPTGEHVELAHAKDCWWLSRLVDWLKLHAMATDSPVDYQPR